MNARLIAFAAVAALSIAPAFAANTKSAGEELLSSQAPQATQHCRMVLNDANKQGTSEYKFCQNEI